MEEDIKILEDMLNKESSIYKRNRRGNKEIKFEVNSNYYNAIENLIAGYKQLEEENRIYGLEGCRVRLKMYIDENYIPTSLVKEKIEELKQKAISYGTFIDKDESFNIQSKISVLQELLGKE